jgi:8-oxo-dGTP pyrophosphatase MutT (NUDIX family)
MGANAEILLIRQDGAVILQTRDNKPDITNPGLVSSFGGHIEAGEEPIEAAVREINEETNLGLTQDQLQFYRTCHKTKAVHGEDWDVYYFVAQYISTEHLAVYEGTGYTVIASKEKLKHTKTTVLLKQVLTDYFDGFRSFIFLPDIDEATQRQLRDDYYTEITHGKQPSTFSQPIALACTGLVASGKSSITRPLAQEIGAVTISSDAVRERFFRLGYNFRQVHAFDAKVIERAAHDRYDIFLDFNISTSISILDKLQAAGYRTLVIHANPPYAYIRDKILSGKARQAAERKGEIMSFFPKDEFLYESMLRWKADHQAALPELQKRYGIWFEADTSAGSSAELARQIIERFHKEMHKI